MNSEDAYNEIIEYLLFEANGNDWDQILVSGDVYYKACSFTSWILKSGRRFQSQVDTPITLSQKTHHAILFLRDDLYATTGERIWSLEFILEKSGKFNISYCYEKPEWYDDSNEILTN